ncbi:hypothetical protein AM10699_08640 [Acaryochloris marina MBIC10699]|nr:hypothetical protein AM10699_08640 [Acaryochloris marina MBIC10699]
MLAAHTKQYDGEVDNDSLVVDSDVAVLRLYTVGPPLLIARQVGDYLPNRDGPRTEADDKGESQ